MRLGRCSSWCREPPKKMPWHGSSAAIRRYRRVTSPPPTASSSSSSTAPPWVLPDYHLTCDLTRSTLSDILVTQRQTKFTSGQGRQHGDRGGGSESRRPRPSGRAP